MDALQQGRKLQRPLSKFLLALVAEIAVLTGLALLLSPMVMRLWPQPTQNHTPSVQVASLSHAMVQQLGQPPPQFQASALAQTAQQPQQALQADTHPLWVASPPVHEPKKPVKTVAKVSFPLSLNGASATTLEALPGVGPVLAQRIVDYREKHGGRFTSLTELDDVKGIGKKKLVKLLPLLTLG